jgi:hypothetical protein
VLVNLPYLILIRIKSQKMEKRSELQEESKESDLANHISWPNLANEKEESKIDNF